MPSALGAMVAPRAWLTDYRIVGLKQKVRKIIDTTVSLIFVLISILACPMQI